ncbi:MAG: MarR family winged helix-turn-helix transcriptional regulator [Acidimicrobiales bacterium]
MRPSAKSSVRAPHESGPANSLRVSVARIYRALRVNSDWSITPSQGSALARIEQCEPVRLGVLAQLEGVSAASMSRIVESLEAQGIVVRIPDPLDGRVSMVKISATGMELISAYRTASTRAIETALSTLSRDEQSSLHEALPILEKLSQILQVGASKHQQ